MISFDRETMTMVASIAALAIALYVYREMQILQNTPPVEVMADLPPLPPVKRPRAVIAVAEPKENDQEKEVEQ